MTKAEQEGVREAVTTAVKEHLPIALVETFEHMVKDTARKVLRNYRLQAMIGFLLLAIAGGILYVQVRETANQNADAIRELQDLQHRIIIIEHPSPDQLRVGIKRAISRCERDAACRRLLLRLARQASRQSGSRSDRVAPRNRIGSVGPGTRPGPGAPSTPRQRGGGPSTPPASTSPDRTPLPSGSPSPSSPPAAPVPPPADHPRPPLSVQVPGPASICTPTLGVNCP